MQPHMVYTILDVRPQSKLQFFSTNLTTKYFIFIMSLVEFYFKIIERENCTNNLKEKFDEYDQDWSVPWELQRSWCTIYRRKKEIYMDGTEIPKSLENQLLKLLKLSIICQTKKEKRENYIQESTERLKYELC